MPLSPRTPSRGSTQSAAPPRWSRRDDLRLPPDGPDLLGRLAHLAEHDPERLLYVELLDGVHESARPTARELQNRAAAVAAARAGQPVG